jgi:hypothetical protein
MKFALINKKNKVVNFIPKMHVTNLSNKDIVVPNRNNVNITPVKKLSNMFSLIQHSNQPCGSCGGVR